jgi:outer membrane protein TolC
MRARRRTIALAAAALLPTLGCTPDATRPVARAQVTAPKTAIAPATTAYSPLPLPAVIGRNPLDLEAPPATAGGDLPLPINLATAFQLAGARPLDVQIAGRQVAAAAAAFDRARVLWLPNIAVGADYFAHTGPQQNFAGEIVRSNRNTFMAGFGPNVVFSFADAVYAPLAARQDVRTRQAVQQVAINDVSFQVADAYFTVQQARGELAGALLAEKLADDLARRATALASGLAPPAEENRAKVELARRRQVVIAARERWRVAGAEVSRLLRLDPTLLLEPAEPAFLPVTVIDPAASVDTLIPIALSTRPELAAHQAVVQATLARLKQEKIRPLVPSLAVRSVSTNPSGSLGYGAFGGGPNDRLENFSGRFDIDMQLVWEFQSLGLANRARVAERRAENEAALLDLFRTQDRIAAEVVQAYAEVRAAAERLNVAEPALREAIQLANRSLEGLGQTRRLGDAVVLVVRPQEAVAAVQALGQANADFFSAVSDYNRAQFRLYRALGHPAQCLAGAVAEATPVESVADPGALLPVGVIPSVLPPS